MNYYLDASAWVKRYFAEEGTPWMGTFWRSEPAVVCATLGLIEVLATVSRRSSPSVTRENLQATLATVHRDFAGMTPIPLTDPVIRIAAELAPRRRLRGADCVHLASAIYLREQLGESPTIVACDLELLQAAAEEGFATADPTTNPPLPR